MLIHRIFEPRWNRDRQQCGRDLGFGRQCTGTLSVRRQRLSGWPAHQADPQLAIVMLPTLGDRDVSIEDPSQGHRIGLGICDSCSVKIPIHRSDCEHFPASQPCDDLWGEL